MKRNVLLMVIYGLQKLTLLDFPGKVACTVFTGGCNFRCPFCHNASLVLEPGRDGTVPSEEFFAMLKKRQGILDGVCVTGGEPLLQPDLEDFLNKIKDLGYLIKLDTNGSSPDKLKRIIDEKLVDYVAMDIKSAKETYPKLTGIQDIYTAPIEKSVKFLLSGAFPYEFRTTAVKGLHTKEDFAAIAKWIAGAKQYFIQSFVDSGDLIGADMGAFSKEEMKDFLETVREYVPSAGLRGVE